MGRMYNQMVSSNPQQQSWSFDGLSDQGRRRRRQNRRQIPLAPSEHLETNVPSQRDAIQQNWRHRPNPQITQNAQNPRYPQNPQHTRPPHQNPFGTREEIESEDYQSPVAQMFGRAWGRYRDAELARLNSPVTEQLSMPQPLPQPNYQPSAQRFSQLRGLDDSIALVQETLNRLHMRPGPPNPILQGPLGPVEYPSPLDDFHHSEEFLQTLDVERINPIDAQPRPPPLTNEQMTVSIACKICTEQKADTLFDPCMHIVVCHWCSQLLQDAVRQRRREQHSHPGANPGPNRWQCPLCRRKVMTARRVYLG